MQTCSTIRKAFFKAAVLVLLSVAEAQSTLLSYSGGGIALTLGASSTNNTTGQRAFGFTENTAGSTLSAVTLNVTVPITATPTTFTLTLYTGSAYTPGQKTSPVTTSVETFTNPTFNTSGNMYTFTLPTPVALSTTNHYYIVAQDNDSAYATIYGGNAGTFSGTAASPIAFNTAPQSPGALYATADNTGNAGNTNVSELTNASSNTPGFTLIGSVPEPSIILGGALLTLLAGAHSSCATPRLAAGVSA